MNRKLSDPNARGYAYALARYARGSFGARWLPRREAGNPCHLNALSGASHAR